MENLGKLLIVFGVVAVILGAALLFTDRLPGALRWVGRLPGDVVVRRGPVTFYFPLVTSLVVSAVLTLLLNLFGRR